MPRRVPLQRTMSPCRKALCLRLSRAPGEAAGEEQGQQPGSAAARWCAGCTPCVGAAVRRRSLSSCSSTGRDLAWLTSALCEVHTGHAECASQCPGAPVRGGATCRHAAGSGGADGGQLATAGGRLCVCSAGAPWVAPLVLLPHHIPTLSLSTACLLLRRGDCLQALLRPALQARSAGESAAAAAVLHTFCRGNREGQSALIATILPTGEQSATGAGAWRILMNDCALGLLSASLSMPGSVLPTQSWHAAVAPRVL